MHLPRTRETRMRVAACMLALAISTVACGGSNRGGEGGLAGELSISGSSTVEPITSLVAEKFQSENSRVSISVDGPGTTDGFALLCDGKIPVAGASRPIDREEEVPACKRNGIDFVELTIGLDGITVVTSHENDEVECLNFADLYALLGPESQGFEKWSDAQDLAKELGSDTIFPDEELVITAPGEESGTWGSFTDLALKNIAEGRGFDDVTTRPDYQASANDNVIVEGIEGAPHSLGWVGFAYYEGNTAAVRGIPIASEAGRECVEPTPETIRDRTYPLSRDLYVYVNKDEAQKNESVKAYVDFLLSDEGLVSVSEAGYVEEPLEVIEATRQGWQNAMSASP